MKRMEQIRTAIAVLLLSVVLPMALVLPFHHHEADESALDSCEFCTHHLPHQGHLASNSQMDNCLICQLLGVTYLPEESVDAPCKPHVCEAFVQGPASSVHSVLLQSLSTRAPPSSFC